MRSRALQPEKSPHLLQLETALTQQQRPQHSHKVNFKKRNAFESSWNHPPPLVCEKILSSRTPVPGAKKAGDHGCNPTTNRRAPSPGRRAMLSSRQNRQHLWPPSFKPKAAADVPVVFLSTDCVQATCPGRHRFWKTCYFQIALGLQKNGHNCT